MCLSHQVLGHTKTILVLLTSWGVLHEHMSSRKLCGMVLAVGGMVLYGYFNNASFKQGSSNSNSGVAASGDSKPLLPVTSKVLPPVPSRDKLSRSVSRDAMPRVSSNRDVQAYHDTVGPALMRSSSNINGRSSKSIQDLTAVLTANAIAASTTEKRSVNVGGGGGGGGGSPPHHALAGSSSASSQHLLSVVEAR